MAVGGPVAAVVVADLDRDLHPDVIAATPGLGGTRILRGHGDGTFEPTGEVPLLANELAVGDLDGDGVLDLVVAGTFGGLLPGVGGGLAALLGNGDATFGPANVLTLEQGFGSLALADLDRDGTLDLVAANHKNVVGAFLGRGDGSFDLPATFAAGQIPQDVLAADFDGDGREDLAVANFWSHDVTLLFGNGDGSFREAEPVAVGDGPSSLTVADFNGDGFLDLATGNRISEDLSVLIGRGDSSFDPETRIAVPSIPQSVVASDVDGDGRVDLVTATFAELVVFPGLGDGSFLATDPIPVPEGPTDVAVADLNADGHADAVVAIRIADEIGVFLGAPDGSFPVMQRFPAGAGPSSVAVADVDGDGTLDLAVANAGAGDRPGSVGLLRGNGDGTFAPARFVGEGVGRGRIAVADFDGDGTEDLAATNPFRGDLTVFLGRGGGTMAAWASFPSGGASLAAADLDGDDRIDLVGVPATFAGLPPGQGDVGVLLNRGIGIRLPICPPLPRPTCRAAARSTLVLVDEHAGGLPGPGGRDRIAWSFGRGVGDDTLDDFGDPTEDTQQALCLYQGAARGLFLEIPLPPNAAGGAWEPLGSVGYRYRDKLASHLGLAKATLKAARAGQSKLQIRARGPKVPFSALTLPLAVRHDVIAQLYNPATGRCWQSVFPPAAVRRHKIVPGALGVFKALVR